MTLVHRKLRTLASLAALLASGAPRIPAQSAPAPSSGKTAAEVYKNIQVLKEIPANQLIPTMQFITASLGVQCDFCHVEGAFDKDDKQSKQTARKMMQMMFAINKDNFDGHRQVTCYSCHRGAHKPVAIPIISEAAPPPSIPAEHEAASSAALPAADAILSKYLQAAGGAEAISHISTRVQTGTLNVGPQQFPVEIISKMPRQQVMIVQFPRGESRTVSNGHTGWLSMPGRPTLTMSASEADAAAMDADLHLPAVLSGLFEKLTVKPGEKIDGRDVYMVEGTRSGLPPVQLYFDENSGMLLREVRYVETPLGLNPTQIDYSDYRAADGVKIPFRWTIARPNARFTIQIDQVEQNHPVQSEQFQEPAPSVSPSGRH